MFVGGVVSLDECDVWTGEGRGGRPIRSVATPYLHHIKLSQLTPNQIRPSRLSQDRVCPFAKKTHARP